MTRKIFLFTILIFSIAGMALAATLVPLNFLYIPDNIDKANYITTPKDGKCVNNYTSTSGSKLEAKDFTYQIITNTQGDQMAICLASKASARLPYNSALISQDIKDNYFFSSPTPPDSTDCPIGANPQDISRYSKLTIKDDKNTTIGVMGVCLINKVDRQAALDLINNAASSKGSVPVSFYELSYPLPCQPFAGGSCPEPSTPAGYIARLYQFAMMISGLMAFGVIVYAGLKYVLAAGNIGDQKQAREEITNAVWGLILLFGAYLILNTINPALVNLKNPGAEPIKIESVAPAEEQESSEGAISDAEKNYDEFTNKYGLGGSETKQQETAQTGTSGTTGTSATGATTNQQNQGQSTAPQEESGWNFGITGGIYTSQGNIVVKDTPIICPDGQTNKIFLGVKTETCITCEQAKKDNYDDSYTKTKCPAI